ncbi:MULTISPECIES: hypothetical protein [unclassified Nitratiruptor]|uniref:hypothetical protein n=1 Tax=unclassified Nitratiruptor TaxID=2624044 RepID=UPI00191692ED|nr:MULTISPECIES: hypothetical protein [unclassified Nitratiruptor]BCD60032.1 hypothetical protein NitYY0810_C0795 [Nitratiruptor sp. YY08-10]BCD63954.1 hypothetical protein NitYY0814_C0793 [Nitratiruptor sp. YY08-14]BCD64477.1 hypothetical protein NitYY0814_C1324 [Nitratiruptor sp. YY08-14]
MKIDISIPDLIELKSIVQLSLLRDVENFKKFKEFGVDVDFLKKSMNEKVRLIDLLENALKKKELRCNEISLIESFFIWKLKEYI